MKRIVVLLISCIVISCQDNAIECVNYSGVVMSQGNLKSKIDVIDFPFCLWKKSKSVDVQARSTYSSSVSVTKKGYHKIGFVVEYDFNTYYGAMAEMEVRDYLSDKIIEYDARSIIVEDDVMGDFISMYFPADIFDINTAVGIFQQFESLYENAFFSYAYNVNVVVKDHVEWIEEETGGGGGGKGAVFQPEDGEDAYRIINDNQRTTLTPEQIEKLKQALEELMLRYPIMADLIYFLAVGGVEIGFVVFDIPGDAEAGYFLDYLIGFPSEANITVDFLFEEMLHAVQHEYYGTVMMEIAHRNVEFEVKVLQDFMNTLKYVIPPVYKGAFSLEYYVNDDSYVGDYGAFILDMVYGEGEFDEGKYQSMYSRWQGYKDYEGLLEYDPRLLKEIIYEILN